MIWLVPYLVGVIAITRLMTLSWHHTVTTGKAHDQ